jgi:hypothetical protein
MNLTQHLSNIQKIFKPSLQYTSEGLLNPESLVASQSLADLKAYIGALKEKDIFSLISEGMNNQKNRYVLNETSGQFLPQARISPSGFAIIHLANLNLPKLGIRIQSELHAWTDWLKPQEADIGRQRPHNHWWSATVSRILGPGGLDQHFYTEDTSEGCGLNWLKRSRYLNPCSKNVLVEEVPACYTKQPLVHFAAGTTYSLTPGDLHTVTPPKNKVFSFWTTVRPISPNEDSRVDLLPLDPLERQRIDNASFVSNPESARLLTAQELDTLQADVGRVLNIEA